MACNSITVCETNDIKTRSTRSEDQLARLGLCGCPVLVSAADVDGVVASGPAVARIAVSTEHAADDVTQVRHIIHVGQR